jgi:hypothetical protein
MSLQSLSEEERTARRPARETDLPRSEDAARLAREAHELLSNLSMFISKALYKNDSDRENLKLAKNLWERSMVITVFLRLNLSSRTDIILFLARNPDLPREILLNPLKVEMCYVSKW